MNSTCENIRLKQSGGILTIRIERPEKKNALNRAMYRAIIAALGEAAADVEVRVVMIRGSADCFSAGNDLADFEDRKPGKSAGMRFLEAMALFEKPLIAAVAGVAVGIGVTLLLHCDLVIAAKDTRFRMPFVPLGLAPEGASTLLLPLAGGYQRAARLLLTGDFFIADDARDAGIVSEVVSAGVLFTRAGAVASQLAALPGASLLETKRLMKSHLRETVLEAIETERLSFEKLIKTNASKAARAMARKPPAK